MRGFILTLLACLIAFGAAPLLDEAQAAPRVGFKRAKKSRPDGDKAYSLEDIMKSPKEYHEREVFFYCRFATTSNLFKNINTRFNSSEHTNFAVWPDKTVLWDEKGRKNVLPTLYVTKAKPENLETLRILEKYELVAVTGYVMDVYAGYPWILVTGIERSELPSDRLCEPVVEHMQSGANALSVNAGGVAARHFEQALTYGLPSEYRAKAYEQLAQAYLLDNKLDKALEYLRLAVEADRSDPILHLALADVALRMSDPGEALAHCEFALERSGRHPQVYGIMGEARSLMGEYVKAFTDLNAGAGTPGITPREKAMVNVRRARIYVRAGRQPDAASVYAAASEPGEPLAGEAWLHNEIGLFYEKLYLETADERYLDSAYSAYEEASRLGRLDASYLYNMTEIEFRRQRIAEKPDFAKVRELIDRINQVEPEYTPARILEGRMLFAEDKPEEAEYRYQSVSSQIGHDAMALMALAEAYMDINRHADAATAVRRARRLEPWNVRVQALGEHLEETAKAVAAAREEARRRAWPDDYSRGDEWWQREEWRREGWDVDRMAPSPQYETRYREAPQYYEQPEQCDQPAPRYGNPGGYHESAPSPEPQQQYEQYVDPELEARRYRQPRPQQRYEPQTRQPADPYQARGNGQGFRPQQGLRPPAPAAAPRSVRPAGEEDQGQGGTYRLDGRLITVRPGESVRVSGDGQLRPEAGDNYPQDIQASARPSLPGRPEKPYPVTEVRLPESVTSRRRSEPQPLNLGYTPAPEAVPDNRPESRRNQEPDYGFEPEYDDGSGDGYGYEDEYIDEGYGEYDNRDNHDFGMIPGVVEAYASLPTEDYYEQDPGATSVPRAFSFEPDMSPVIIAGLRAPGESGRDMPVRNANVFRRHDGGRQPAEIIEKEPVRPRQRNDDASAMAPAEGGAVHRAEVRLPSSSLGIGMTSDYYN